jgi:adenine-specific DNA-methyltransferase
MPPKKKSSTPKLSQPVHSVKHNDKRANIPTEELRDFIADEEKAPKTVLYPRDPSLDPQLVWKGKDEQDSQDLAVPAVPIYIQEHIKPQNIIELVRSESKKEEPQQPMLFGDFNGLTFEDRVDFYHHEQNWSNRMILGDSLMVMTSLAEKEGLKGKVQMIYLDPPYGIKFGSNWQVSTRKRDVKDGKAEDTTRQPEQVKAFRDTWQLGIHSYLAYLRDRLVTARELLVESGSIFVQIGDENIHLVRSLLDEVFGSENYVGLVTFNKTTGAGSPAIGTLVLASVTDYVIWYSKSIDQIKYRQLYSEKDDSFDPGGKYSYLELETGERTPINTVIDNDGTLPKNSRIFRLDNMTSQSSPPILFQFSGKGYTGGWKTNHLGLQRLTQANRIAASKTTLNYVRYAIDFSVYPLNNIWADVGGIQSRIDPKIYVVQTNTKVIERCMLMTTDPGDLVLDPTCGSGTTAYVAEQWGRRWITIDTSRVSIALARTRLMAGRYPYYLLADSAEGRKKESEITGAFSASETEPTGDIKRGFVYERVPHVTLKSIANNEEIDEIYARYQEQLEPLRAEINTLTKKKWEEWEIPRDTSTLSGALSGEVEGLLQQYWELRRARQKEIDASIARRADTEFLYDKPYQDSKRVRVSGPFTVESLSPHRVLTTDDPSTS